MDGMKVKFDSVLSEAQEKKPNNASGLLKKCEYEEIVNRMKELEKLEVKKTQKDYRLLRKHDIMEISVEGTRVQKLVKKGTVLKYVCAEDLFDTIKAAHLANGHGGRNILSKALSEKYANITIDQMKAFLQFCEECQLKKSSVRKSVVVKPILSNSMNSRCQVWKILSHTLSLPLYSCFFHLLPSSLHLYNQTWVNMFSMKLCVPYSSNTSSQKHLTSNSQQPLFAMLQLHTTQLLFHPQ